MQMEGAAPKSASAGKIGGCQDCAGKLRKLSCENSKLRQKLEEVAARRDYYANLYYEALAELESYKRRIHFVVNDLEELGLTRDPASCAALKNGFKEQVVGVCDGYTHVPVQLGPDSHSIPLYRTSHSSTSRSSARKSHHCHPTVHQMDMLQASQSAPLLPQHSPGVHLPASRVLKPPPGRCICMQKCPSRPSQPWPHAERQIPPRPPAPEACSCPTCLPQKHLHSHRLRPQRSLDSACFCNGSDDSSSPICDEGHSPFELLDPPSPYKALRQNSGRTRPADPATPMVNCKTNGSHNRTGTVQSQVFKNKASTRRTRSDSDITSKRDAEVQQLDVDDTPSLYQKLSLRELKELSQFIATPECDLTALGVADSQLCQANMMEALCNGLKNNSSIKELSLPHNGLGWRSLEVLFGLLLKNPTNIRVLRLCSNNISADSFQVIKDFLMDTDLQLLDLRSNDIAHNITRCKQLGEVRGSCEILFQNS